MKIIVRKSRFTMNPDHFLRKAGYGFVNDRRASDVSYARRFSTGLYPRFHMYYKEDRETITFNLHVDQKQSTSTGAGHKHNAEYDGALVEGEIYRLKKLIVDAVNGGI
jgi:hypothetical protein